MTDQRTSPNKLETDQYSRLKLRKRWGQRWYDSLSSLLDVKPSSDRIGDLLQQSASNGNSERALAGDHETRELIELLQNGRDAIRKGRKEGYGGGATGDSTKAEDRGRVYISVHDTGLLVANTGAPFDFLDEEVEEAVCMVGESSKQGLDYIGSKGVGLKSILASGEAVEFWTSLDESTSQSADGAVSGPDPLRVRLSRAYTTSAIYAALGITPDTSTFQAHCRELETMGGDIDSAQLDDLLRSRDSSDASRSDLGVKPRERIAKQPLFYLPVELDPDDRDGTLAQHARALVTGKGPGTEAIEESQQGAFRTAVFIEYIDDAWRELLPELPDNVQSEVFARRETTSSSLESTTATSGNAPDVAQQLWAQLTGDDDEKGLQPETLVQLGEIDTLVADRVQTATDSAASETETGPDQVATSHRVSWTIDPSRRNRAPQIFEIGPGVRYQSLTVIRSHEAATDGDTTSRSFVFDVFERPDEWDHEPAPDNTEKSPEPRILIPKKEDNERLSELQQYPLNLYYPIENTNQLAFPFCLHGRFRVQTNRKDLSPNERDYNKWVLDASSKLIQDIAQLTARDDKFGSLYPWVLLPPGLESHSNRGASDVLHEFVDDVYDSIRSSECFPQEATTPVRPNDALFHWNPDVVNGFSAYFELTESSEVVGPEAPDTISLPSRSLVDGFLQYRQQLEPRVRGVLTAETVPSAWTDTVADDWLQILATLSAPENRIQCHQHTGRALFAGLTQLLVPNQETADGDIKSVLKNYEEDLHGTPLLPCLHRETAQSNEELAGAGSPLLSDSDHTDDVLLVPVESLNITEDRGSRTVLWNLTGTEGGTELRTPPADAGFTVYFFDPKTEQRQDVPRVLQNVSRLWGVRDYDDQQNYYRSLVHSFSRHPTERTTLSSEAIAFLADHVAQITAEDLSTSEGGFISTQYLQKALRESGGATTQRRRLRRRLAVRDAELGVEMEAIAPDTAIRDFSMGDAWQRLRGADRDRTTDDGDEDDRTTDWDAYNPLFSTVLPDPSAEAWEPVYETMGSTEDRELQQRLVAETLSLVGISVFSGLNILWRFGPNHPSNPHWSPREWSLTKSESDGNDSSAHLVSLSDTLDEKEAYLDLIIGPGYHPSETIDHSSTSTCDGALATFDTQGGNLGGWVWIADLESLQQEPANTIELLQRHDEQLASSVLHTGWTCNGGQHNRYSWNEPVPTLFNWQLRTLPIWELEISEDMQDAWGEAGRTLRWALPESEGNRPTAADLFPQVTDDTQLTPVLREAFGIRPIDELAPVAVADRLQQLLEVLTDIPLSEAAADHVPLHVEEHDRRWQSAYNQLVSKLTQHLETVSSDDSPTPFATDLDLLTYFPVKHHGEWVAADIEMLRSRGEVRHFDDRTPKFWEKNEANKNNSDLYILERPRSGSFTPLRDHFNSDKIDANPPTITESDGIDINLEFDGREEIQNRLRERRELLIAAMERTNEEEIKGTEEKLTAAIEQLAAGSFPEDIEHQLRLLDTSSGIYIVEKSGEPGLILNQNIIDEETTDSSAENTAEAFEASHASIGLSLLVQRPGKFREFEHTLQHDYDSLYREYQDRFPLEIVQGVLGTKRVQDFRQRRQVLAKLLTVLGSEPDLPELGAMFSIEAENSDERIQRFESIITAEDNSSLDARESEQVQFVQHALKLRELLPEWARFVTDALFGQHSPPSYEWWCQKIAALSPDQRGILIAWLAENRTFFDLLELSSSVRLRYENLSEVIIIATRVEAEQRETVSEWRSQIEQEDVSISWTDRIDDTTELVTEMLSTEYPNEWFFYADADRFGSELVDPILRRILSDASNDEKETIRNLITGYIYDNDLQKQKTRSDARERQHEAFKTLNTISSDRWESLNLDTFSSAGASWEDGLEVNIGSGGTGGNESTSTARPQRAEAFTMVHILRRLRDWIGNDQERATKLLNGFRELREDQEALLEQLSNDQARSSASALEFKWHLSTRWPALSSALEMAPQEVIDHLESFDGADSPSLTESPLLKLMNITQEQGPGFDSIDPFGPLQASHEPMADGSTFAAVEVKAVRGDPPYGFRLTSNELRRCRSFLAAKNRIPNETGREYLSTGAEYVIRFVKVPSADTSDWTAATEFARPDLILTEDRMENLFSGDPLEFSVKGGYVNLTLDR